MYNRNKLCMAFNHSCTKTNLSYNSIFPWTLWSTLMWLAPQTACDWFHFDAKWSRILYSISEGITSVTLTDVVVAPMRPAKNNVRRQVQLGAESRARKGDPAETWTGYYILWVPAQVTEWEMPWAMHWIKVQSQSLAHPTSTKMGQPCLLWDKDKEQHLPCWA